MVEEPAAVTGIFKVELIIPVLDLKKSIELLLKGRIKKDFLYYV